MKRLIALTMLALLVVGVVSAIRLLPWWALALGFVSLVAVGKFLIKRLVKSLMLMPFRAKGAVLKGASAQVDSISRADASGDKSNQYVAEVTITPRATEGPFRLWEPGELRLVRPESVPRPHSDEPDPDEEDSACAITRVEIAEDGQWKDDEGMKYGGAQRLRLHLTAQHGVHKLKFRYYFEEFGNIKLPQAKPAELSPVTT